MKSEEIIKELKDILKASAEMRDTNRFNDAGSSDLTKLLSYISEMKFITSKIKTLIGLYEGKYEKRYNRSGIMLQYNSQRGGGTDEQKHTRT